MKDIKLKIKYKVVSYPLPLILKLSNICSLFHTKIIKEFISSVEPTLKSKLPELLANASILLNNYEWVVNVNINYSTPQNLGNRFSITIQISTYNDRIKNMTLVTSDNTDIFTLFLGNNTSFKSYCDFLSSLTPECASLKYLFVPSNKLNFDKFDHLYQNLYSFLNEVNSKDLIPNKNISIRNLTFLIDSKIKWHANYKPSNMMYINFINCHIAFFGTTGQGKSEFIKNFKEYYALEETSIQTFLFSLMSEDMVNNEYIEEITDDNVFEILEITKLLNY